MDKKIVDVAQTVLFVGIVAMGFRIMYILTYVAIMGNK